MRSASMFTPVSRGEAAWTRWLLLCGAASALLYAGMNVFVAALWPDYSTFSQTISELAAIDAPTRSVWNSWSVVYSVLFILFGLGVRRASGDHQRRVLLGDLLIVYGISDLLWPLCPMHLRPALAADGATFTDTLHMALAVFTVVLMVAIMGFGAFAFSGRFRTYTLISLALLFVFGVLTGSETTALEAGLPTPGMGVWERINIGVFLLWELTLAVMLLRSASGTTDESQSRR